MRFVSSNNNGQFYNNIKKGEKIYRKPKIFGAKSLKNLKSQNCLQFEAERLAKIYENDFFLFDQNGLFLMGRPFKCPLNDLFCFALMSFFGQLTVFLNATFYSTNIIQSIHLVSVPIGF